MTPYQHAMVYVMSTNPQAKFARFNDFSEKRNFSKAVEGGLDSYLETITNEDDWFETETEEAIYDRAMESDDYDYIESRVEDGYEELIAAINGCKKPGHFMFVFNNMAAPVPNQYKDEIIDYCEDVGIAYEIDPEVDPKQIEYVVGEIQDDWKDAAEYARDPLGYYGMSQRDFM